MSFYSSRHSNLSYSCNLSPTMSLTGSSFSKSKQVAQIFLDKKTIVKRMQKLMLDVKDLDTKMFISKTISFLEQNLSTNTKPFQQIDLNKQSEKQNLQQKMNSDLFANNCSNVNPTPNANMMEVSMMIPSPFQSNLDMVNESKFMSETAASDGFFHSNSGFVPPPQPVIEQTMSEAGTVQCQCGLFDGFLEMVSRLMKAGLVKNRQQNEGEFLEIDQAFIQQITDELIQSSKQTENKHIKQLQNVTDRLVEKDASCLSLSGEVNKLNADIQVLRKNLLGQVQLSEKFQHQSIELKQNRTQIQKKLSVCSKQLQKANYNKSILEQSKNLEIEALKFAIELKDNEIENMKTIVESLQKRSKEYDVKIESLKKIQEPQLETYTISLTYDLAISLSPDPAYTPAKASDSIILKKQVSSLHSKLLKHLEMQNHQLKQQCLLLYEKIAKFQLF